MVPLELVCYLTPIEQALPSPWHSIYTTFDTINTHSHLFVGRTTFVNTLCSKDVLQHKEADDASEAHVEDGVKIKPITVG